MNNFDISTIENSVEGFDFLQEASPELPQAAYQTPNTVPYDQAKQRMVQTESLSFQKPIEPEDLYPENQPKSNEPEYVMYHQFIDKFNSKNIRREITPSVCRICGFDVAEKRHGRWGLVPVSEQSTVKSALTAHIRDIHTLGDLHIIKKSQLPRQWLGSNAL